MTSVHGRIRTLTFTVAVALSAAVASAQSAKDVPAIPHKDHARSQATQLPGGDQPMAQMQDMMARMAAMDERVQMLVAEMHWFVGEPKITAMTALLTLLVERQSMMHEHMMRMHEGMMGHMMERMRSAAPPDEEPGMMCLPSHERPLV